MQRENVYIQLKKKKRFYICGVQKLTKYSNNLLDSKDCCPFLNTLYELSMLYSEEVCE